MNLKTEKENGYILELDTLCVCVLNADNWDMLGLLRVIAAKSTHSR